MSTSTPVTSSSGLAIQPDAAATPPGSASASALAGALTRSVAGEAADSSDAFRTPAEAAAPVVTGASASGAGTGVTRGAGVVAAAADLTAASSWVAATLGS